MDGLTHAVPRLDAPDRLWLLPAPQAKWLSSGLFAGPVVAQALVWLYGVTPAAVWGEPLVWLLWLLAALIGCLGAFVRPGGLDVAQWVSVWLDYQLRPKRAVWKPIGKA